MPNEKQFKFVAIKNVDQSAVQVIMYEHTLGELPMEENGTLLFSVDGAIQFREQGRRTKFKFEGFDDLKKPGPEDKGEV